MLTVSSSDALLTQSEGVHNSRSVPSLGSDDDAGWVEVGGRRKGKAVLGDFMIPIINGRNANGRDGGHGGGRGRSLGAEAHPRSNCNQHLHADLAQTPITGPPVKVLRKQAPSFHIAPDASPRSWSSVVSPGHSPSLICDLQFVPTWATTNSSTVKITKEDVATREKRWQNLVLVYVVDEKPYYANLKGIILRLWKPKGRWDIFSRENGFFLIRFEEVKDCERALSGGPWLFDERLMIVRKWRKGLRYDKDLLGSIPIWITLPELCLDVWNYTAIAKIASSLGKPMHIDLAAATRSRVSFAKILVVVDANFQFPNHKMIRIDDGEEFKQSLVYEWKPSHCGKCEYFGHKDEDYAKVGCELKNKEGEKGVKVGGSSPVVDLGDNEKIGSVRICTLV